jgi:hypothetical protein
VIRVANGVNIMSHQLRDSFCAHKNPSLFVQLVLGLLRCDVLISKVTVGVKDLMEILFSLGNADDIPKTSRVGYISSDFASVSIKCSRKSLAHLLSGGITSLPLENGERHTFSQFDG